MTHVGRNSQCKCNYKDVMINRIMKLCFIKLMLGT